MTAGAGILHDELPTEQAFTHGGPVRPAFDIEVLDLRDWALPIFAEHQGTMGDVNEPTYFEAVCRSGAGGGGRRTGPRGVPHPSSSGSC
jgi:hypothetical protein